MRARARPAALFAGAALLSATASLSAAAPDSPGAPIRGVRGEPVARAVVRWSDMARQGTVARAPRSAGEADGPRSSPQDLPVPEGALVRMEARAEAAAVPSAALPSPALVASFEALPINSEGGPPDTHGAVGPNHLMVTLNTQVRIQDRRGRALSTVTLFDFWQGLTGGRIDDAPFDPRILYDPYADRWITTAAGNAFRSLLVGVSRTGDPTGSWNLYRIDTEWVDFPTLGFNKDWIVVQGTVLRSTPFHLSTRIWVFGKAELAGAPTRSAIQWWQLAADGGVVQRGRVDDASGVLFYGYPSLAVNGSGDMLLGFTSFSEQQFASGSYAYRAADDPRGTLRAERVLKAGEDSYFRGEDHGRNRWGDYSATSVDPVNETAFWTIQEYAAARDPVSGAYRWGTWWGLVVPEAAPVGRMPPRPPSPLRTPRALPPRGQ